MGNPFGFIAGVAVAACRELAKLYDQKYGTYGEARVRAIQKELERYAAEVDALHVENEKLTIELKQAAVREAILKTDLESCSKHLQTMEHLRDEKIPTGTENPY